MSVRSSMLFPMFAATALASAPAVVAAAPADDLAAVQKHLQAVHSMTADFAQADRSGKVVTGTLTLKQPGKIRFQYEKGVPILIVADGKSLWFLDYSVGQKQRWPIGGSPLGILLDPSRDISKIASIVPSGNADLVAVDAVDPKHPEYGRISLIFQRSAAAPNGLMLKGWVTLDSQNNRTTVKLSNQRFNVPIADNAFRWNDPVRVTTKK